MAVKVRQSGSWVDVSGAAAGGGGISGISVQDESNPVASDVTTLNFTGAGVVATSPTAGTVNVTVSGTGSGIATVNVVQTNYGCSNPISAVASSGITTIGIGTTSNAYGKRFIQSTQPTTDVCNGDIWYDVSDTGLIADSLWSLGTNFDGSGNQDIYRMSDVGIGTENPECPLDVVGRVQTTGELWFNSGYGSAAIAYGVRAWVNFNGSGSIGVNQTIRGSGNVTSVFKSSTGNYTINFTNAMPDANYTFGWGRTGGLIRNILINSSASLTTNSLSIVAANTNGLDDGVDVETITITVVR